MNEALSPGDRDIVLLGIKYEAARVGGVDEAGLAKIEAQIQSEIGDGWKDHPLVLRGRNAVRREHGLTKLGERPRAPAASRTGSASRPWYRRLF